MPVRDRDELIEHRPGDRGIAMLSTHPRPSSIALWTPALTEPACRLCGARLIRTLVDLGHLPLGNRTIAANAPNALTYPLHARICDNCTLVQLVDVVAPETTAARAPCLSTRSAAGLSQGRRQADAVR